MDAAKDAGAGATDAAKNVATGAVDAAKDAVTGAVDAAKEATAGAVDAAKEAATGPWTRPRTPRPTSRLRPRTPSAAATPAAPAPARGRARGPRSGPSSKAPAPPAPDAACREAARSPGARSARPRPRRAEGKDGLLLPVDEEDSVAQLDGVAREADQALHERHATAVSGFRRTTTSRGPGSPVEKSRTLVNGTDLVSGLQDEDAIPFEDRRLHRPWNDVPVGEDERPVRMRPARRSS